VCGIIVQENQLAFYSSIMVIVHDFWLGLRKKRPYNTAGEWLFQRATFSPTIRASATEELSLVQITCEEWTLSPTLQMRALASALCSAVSTMLSHRWLRHSNF
jgi:hypothetical protein